MNKREQIFEQYPDNEFTFLPEEFDHTIMGVIEAIGAEPKICYDREGVIQQYIEEGMTHEEAIEYFDYNTIGSYVGETTPVFMTISFSN